jgi:hypothetical protein
MKIIVHLQLKMVLCFEITFLTVKHFQNKFVCVSMLGSCALVLCLSLSFSSTQKNTRRNNNVVQVYLKNLEGKFFIKEYVRGMSTDSQNSQM